MAKTEINSEGYLVFSDSKIPVHRWKAEKKYGKESLIGMEVHHIDRDRRNNEYSNLLLVSKEDHYNIYQYENKRSLITHLIIILSIVYIVSLILTNFLTKYNPNLLSIMRFSVVLIFLLSIELHNNVLSKVIKRPNERLIN